MKIVLLTTQTTHHAYFARAMARRFDQVTALCETQGPSWPFETAHPFEEERERLERERWFGGAEAALEDVLPTRRFSNLNAPEAVAALVEEKADMAVAFGPGRLDRAVIEAAPGPLLNLHGGDPEDYRGLDSHLWAIYHGDFAGLVTTLHRVDAGLDTGDIVLQEALRLTPGMPLSALRAVNAEACVRLCVCAADMMERQNDVLSRPQRRKGRYYSAMPGVLKDLCVKRFAAHTRGLVS